MTDTLTEDQGGQGRPVVESDVAAVSRYLEADVRVREAAQRVGRATDALSEVHQPLRRLDTERNRALVRLHELDQAEASRTAWAESMAQHRDVVKQQAADRTAARGRGPAAWAARERLSRSGYDTEAYAERSAQFREQYEGHAARLGSAEPAQWLAMREAARQTLITYGDRRERALVESVAAIPAARDRLEVEQATAAAAEQAREAAAAELAARGLDVDRVREVAVSAAALQRGQPSDPVTEAALARWAERQQPSGPGAGGDSADRGNRPPPEPGRDCER